MAARNPVGRPEETWVPGSSKESASAIVMSSAGMSGVLPPRLVCLQVRVEKLIRNLSGVFREIVPGVWVDRFQVVAGPGRAVGRFGPFHRFPNAANVEVVVP